MRKFFASLIAFAYLLVATPAPAGFVINSFQFAAAPPVATYVGTTVDASAVLTYTFTAHAIGTAAADRYVLIGVNSRGSLGSPQTISSATIGGNAATLLHNVSSGNYVGWIGLSVPTGTTATIVITFTGGSGQNNCIIHVYNITGLTSTTLTDSAHGTGVDPSTGANLDVSAGGIGFAVAMVDSSTAGTTWVGITGENHDAVGDFQVNTTAHLQFAGAQSGLTVQANFVSTSTEASVSAVSMR